MGFLESFQETPNSTRSNTVTSTQANPKISLHKQSGRGRAVWTGRAGNYCDKLLPGAYGSAKSKAAFTRLLMEHEAVPHNGSRKKSGAVIIEVLKLYLEYAKRHYRRPDGSPTSELREHKLRCGHCPRTVRRTTRGGIRPAETEGGSTAMGCFRPVSVGMQSAYEHRPQDLQVGGRRRTHADAEVLMGLNAVAGLQKGRTPARETEPIQPVADAVVDATLPYLSRYVAGLIEFQRLTGCRPGEACQVRRSDIDTGGASGSTSPKNTRPRIEASHE